MEIVDFLEQHGWGASLITFVVSMIPVLELRGAIPIGVSMGMTHLGAMAVSIVGNMVPVPFIVLFIRRIFAWLRSKSPTWQRLITKMEVKAEGKWDKVHRYQFLGLALLVAIPLPGTGAWTGALIAALMDMRLRNALLSIFLGVIVAGILVTGITFGFTSMLG